MTRRTSTIFAAAAVLAASAPAALLAQPPAAESVELSEARRTPAEQQAAAYKDKNWTAPRTSWGHPSLQGTWRPTTCAAFRATGRKRSARKSP